MCITSLANTCIIHGRSLHDVTDTAVAKLPANPNLGGGEARLLKQPTCNGSHLSIKAAMSYVRIHPQRLLLAPYKCCTNSQACNSSLNYIVDFSFQHRGFCSGTHVAYEEELEMRPVVKAFPFRKAVDVKCEIYEPQVPASPAATHTGVAHPLLPPSVLLFTCHE